MTSPPVLPVDDLAPTQPPHPAELVDRVVDAPTSRGGDHPSAPRSPSRWAARARHLGSRLAVTVVVGWLAVGLVLTLVQRSLIYRPDAEVPPVGDVLPGARAVAYTTEDGLVLGGWWLPADGSTDGAAGTGRPAPVVIVFHGIGGNRVGMAPLARGLADRGTSVLLAEYRGYGDSPGTPTEEGLARDARAALRWVRSRPDVDPARIAYLGDSLGTGVATTLAADDPPAVLVLRSPFTSLPDVAAAELPAYPYGTLMWDRYATLDRISGVDAPVLVVVAGRDDVVPPEQSRAVADAARRLEAVVTFPDAGHIDPQFVVGPGYLDAVTAAVGRHAG
ncbi:MAG: alpha/beta hydrolase [Acidimicrobiales bacterium]